MNMLAVRNLSKHFGGVYAVNDVSLEFVAKSVTCVIGPNGAGKSTLLDMLSGSTPASKGEILIEGRVASALRAHQFANLGIVRKFQGANVFPGLTVQQNLEIAALGSRGITANTAASVAEAVGKVKLQAKLHERADSLSHGQRQWLEVGMAIVCHPRVLLLDEPTQGMTAPAALELAELIVGLADRMSVVVIEHNMHFVRKLNCRTIVLDQGSVIADGDFEVVAQDERVRNSYLGRRKC